MAPLDPPASIAKNPSKFTYHGTGTYIVGRRRRGRHRSRPAPRLASRRAGGRARRASASRAILVTHCHADHSPLAAWLREHTGAPTVAFGPHRDRDPDWVEDDTPDEPDDRRRRPRAAPRPPARRRSRSRSTSPSTPTCGVADGEVAASGDGWTLRAVHTPGHTSNHMCFCARRAAGAVHRRPHHGVEHHRHRAARRRHARLLRLAAQRCSDLDAAVAVADARRTGHRRAAVHRCVRRPPARPRGAGAAPPCAPASTMIPDMVQRALRRRRTRSSTSRPAAACWPT